MLKMDIIYQLTDKQIEQLNDLYQREWWTKGRTLEETTRCIRGSQVCIGLVDDSGALQAFARVLTDFTFKALIFDVIVAHKHRGEGASLTLLTAIRNHHELCSVKHFELYCLPELESLYNKFGFSSEVGGIQLMRLAKA
jgi:hypothetical protein